MSIEVSLPRFAPLLDMALYFDGLRTQATAALPPDLFAQDPGDLAFTVTFWMSPGPAPWPGAGPPVGPEAAQSVLDLRGPSGAVLSLVYGPGRKLVCALPGSRPDLTELQLEGIAGPWIYVVLGYAPEPAQLTVRATDGGPAPAAAATELQVQLMLKNESRTLTVGRSAAPGDGEVPYQGMLTRLRIRRTSPDPENDTTPGAMYDGPIGFRSATEGPFAADWRMNEGYGTVAFDYASPNGPLLPVRYQPPPGNHLVLGDGEPATEPVWTVARLSTLVRSATAQPMAHLFGTGGTV
ncbi:hypothetical protein [Streptomyces pseudovenezuelae]|uniref:Aromatic ring-opening dioxygenase LigA n=1 Tax=Streptomyces pseudovenezuelae TaxID=67350 RepID=A0ABT6LZ17_9ACTN|nr:hypothetical protein [Streptomyces pseudovenezuelae]MDH6221556.1 hypothetical protein [Streptomyces pseudovenezuelae]